MNAPIARLCRILPLLAGALLPVAVHAEGAVRVLDCAIVSECDGVGLCQPQSGEVRFRMEPVQVDADGAGEYLVTYGDVRATLRAESPAGPFLWATGTERHALLASSETAFLWHRLVVERAPQATVRFLSCRLRQ